MAASPADPGVVPVSRRYGGPRAVVSLVSGGHFVSHFYILAFPPLFPLLAGEFGLSNTELGGVVSAIMLPVLVLQIPVGEVVDRVGAKPVFVAGIVVTALGVLLAGLAGSYPLVLVGAFVSGVGQAAFHPADYALLEAVVGEEHEGKAFSVHTFGGYAGFAAAPVVVGGLGLAVGWRPALQLAGVAGLAYAALAQLTLATVHRGHRSTPTDDETPSTTVRERLRVLLAPDLVAVAAFFLVLFMIITGIQSFTVVFVDRGLGLGPAVGNTALTAFATTSALGVLAGGPLADRFDVHGLAAGGFLLGLLVTAVLVVGVLPVTALATVVLLGALGLAYGLPLPSRDRLVSLYAPADATGRSFGFVFSAGSLGGFLAPLLLGAVIDLRSPLAAFAVIAALFLVCAGIVGALWLGGGD